VFQRSFPASGVGKSLEELVGSLCFDSFRDRGVEVLSVIANKVEDENREIIIRNYKETPSQVIVNAIPLNPILANPSIKEIVDALNATVLFW
jgi:phosphate acetyltransferase